MIRYDVRDSFQFAGLEVPAGSELTVPLELPRLYDRSEVSMPVRILHGEEPGPTLLLCATVHGDEVNGMEIIYRLLRKLSAKDIRGTVLAVPIVNAYGLVTATRYLPDGRDLNRTFPGSKTGSLTARLAHVLVSELLSRATHVIDLHTGGMHRSNFPQIRATLSLTETLQFAGTFHPPVILDAPARAGSFRQAADKRGIPSLVYETGEALRFDEAGIDFGIQGVLSAMNGIGMLIQALPHTTDRKPTVFARGSRWLRAPASGVFRSQCQLGDLVAARANLGSVSDPLGDSRFKVKSSHSGIVIGRNNMPLVHQGDPLLHIAEVSNLADAESAVERVSPPVTHV